VIARIGGDEFAIILIQTDEYGANSAIERLRTNVREKQDEFLSVAVGMAIAKEGDYLPAVMRQADDHMYAEKAAQKKKLAEVNLNAKVERK
jgi:diguanylate cyclase (GGDEF)-like protein